MIDKQQGALGAQGPGGFAVSNPETPVHAGSEPVDVPSDTPTEDDKAMFDLVVGRTAEALAQDPDGLDTALKADPVLGAVSYGTAALHTVASAAEEAGRPVSFDVLVQAGMQVVKLLGSIANEKGYLPDEQIEVFLKEAFQQSIAKYAQMDMKAGRLDEKAISGLGDLLGQGGQGQAPAAPPAPAGGPQPQGVM